MDDIIDTKVLKRAQDTYGYSNQMAVVAEELCELAVLCTKYVRYPNHTKAQEELRNKIIGEVADVSICLKHITMMFDISDSTLDDVIDKKLLRLQRWLNANDSIYQTTKDRDL